jgi:hypothetical protein
MISMTTADWALVVSLLSFAVSLAGFIWNIWSKFIYPKPRVVVGFAVMEAWGDGGKQGTALGLHAVNHGPIEVTLKSAVCRYELGLFKWQYALMNALDRWPAPVNTTSGIFSGGLPKKLVVGEEFSVYFLHPHPVFQERPIVDVGFTDNFGRHHWAPRKSVMKVRRSHILPAG